MFRKLGPALLTTFVMLGTCGDALAGGLFRPPVANPRESISRWRQSSYTSDWRYGTDVTDSTTIGGFIEDRTGVHWEIAAGHTFRWRRLERIFGTRPPWAGYQLGVPAAIFAQFENDGSLLNTDFQYGFDFEIQWNGDLKPERPFERALWTSRLMVMHRSSHLGDEYLALGAIGRNQNGHPAQGILFERPPVKRVDLSYEMFEAMVAFEWAPFGGNGAARLYAGGDKKFLLPSTWGIGARRPKNFDSPAGRLGFEWRSNGNAASPGNDWLTRSVRNVSGAERVRMGWLTALDLRVARPYNFAACDNPSGNGEAWTPHLWSECPNGFEFDGYAGSWRGMVGLTLLPRGPSSSEWVIALEWYDGYSFNGQFLDQPLRYRPRMYLIPSITATF
jgi:hypothetical protein